MIDYRLLRSGGVDDLDGLGGLGHGLLLPDQHGHDGDSDRDGGQGTERDGGVGGSCVRELRGDDLGRVHLHSLFQ